MRRYGTLIGFCLAAATIAACAHKPDPRLQAYSDKTANSLSAIAPAEEIFWQSHQRYTAALDSLSLQSDPAVHLTITAATEKGFAAKATHDSIPNFSCVML